MVLVTKDGRRVHCMSMSHTYFEELKVDAAKASIPYQFYCHEMKTNRAFYLDFKDIDLEATEKAKTLNGLGDQR